MVPKKEKQQEAQVDALEGVVQESKNVLTVLKDEVAGHKAEPGRVPPVEGWCWRERPEKECAGIMVRHYTKNCPWLH